MVTDISFNNKLVLLAIEMGYTYDDKGNIYGPKGNVLVSPEHRGRKYFTIRSDKLVGYRSTKTIPVHRFIAYGLFGDKALEKGTKVRHLDGDPLNNAQSNLKLGTHSENMMDIPKEKRVAHAKRAASFVRKFTDEQELEIYTFYLSCRSYKKTIEKFNLGNKNMLFGIVKRGEKIMAYSSSGQDTRFST